MNVVYICVYYDFYYESGKTEGVFSDFTNLLAFLADKYDGRIDLCSAVKPAFGEYTNVEIDNGRNGRWLKIEAVKFD